MIDRSETSNFAEHLDLELLRRSRLAIDLTGLDDVLHGATVLVTGAGGSIGQGLLRRLLASSVASVVAFDQSETGLHDLEIEFASMISGVADVDDPERPSASTASSTVDINQSHLHLVVGSVTDATGLDLVFARHRPSVVIHAAAHKHVPLMERNPREAIRNNVGGTLEILRVAHRHDVARFVLVSSDKAACPTGVMGATKALAERATEAAAVEWPSMRAVVARLPNVLGSAGSVVPTFRRQLELGRSVTITDPEATRYFVTHDEAVDTIFATLASAPSGSVTTVDPGEPINVVELARRIATSLEYGVAGGDIAIDVVGPRPGDRRTEVLWADDENFVNVSGPLVRRAASPDDVGMTPADVTSTVAAILNSAEPTEEIRRAIDVVVNRLGSPASS